MKLNNGSKISLNGITNLFIKVHCWSVIEGRVEFLSQFGTKTFIAEAGWRGVNLLDAVSFKFFLSQWSNAMKILYFKFAIVLFVYGQFCRRFQLRSRHCGEINSLPSFADCIDCDSQDTLLEARLKRDLFCHGYDEEARPVRDHTKTTSVTVKMMVKTFDFVSRLHTCSNFYDSRFFFFLLQRATIHQHWR